MKVFVFIQQKPLKITTYTSLTALYEANKSLIPVSKSKLDKDDLEAFPYVDSRIIIAQTETKSSGDVRRDNLNRIVKEEYQKAIEAGSKFATAQEEWKKAAEIVPTEHPSCGRLMDYYKKKKK